MDDLWRKLNFQFEARQRNLLENDENWKKSFPFVSVPQIILKGSFVSFLFSPANF